MPGSGRGLLLPVLDVHLPYLAAEDKLGRKLTWGVCAPATLGVQNTMHSCAGAGVSRGERQCRILDSSQTPHVPVVVVLERHITEGLLAYAPTQHKDLIFWGIVFSQRG